MLVTLYHLGTIYYIMQEAKRIPSQSMDAKTAVLTAQVPDCRSFDDLDSSQIDAI